MSKKILLYSLPLIFFQFVLSFYTLAGLLGLMQYVLKRGH